MNDLAESPKAPGPLTLKAVLDALKERGVEIGYSTLSELIATGDIAQQLGAGGDGSKREFHADVVEVLAAFLPAFKEWGGKRPQAPDFLRGFLRQRNPGETTALLMIGETAKVVDPVAVAEAQGRAQGLAQAERVLTAKEAAEVLSISVPMLRKTVPAWKRFGKSAQGDRWLLSDLLRKV